MKGRGTFALAALVLAGQAAPAGAQTPAATAAPDPGNLAISQQIVAIVMPPDQRMAMIKRIEDAILGPMRASVALPPALDEPDFRKLLDDELARLPAVLTPLMADHLPRLADAMARAYARAFTRAELEQILAFAHTPAGGKYLSRSSSLLQDPDVAAVNGEMIRAGNQATVQLQGQMQVKIRDYLASHPDVVRKLGAAAKKPA